jgi:hypothetical protein
MARIPAILLKPLTDEVPCLLTLYPKYLICQKKQANSNKTL